MSKKLEHFRVLQLRTKSTGCFYTHTEIVGQAIQYLSLLGGSNAARKRPRILLKDCSNAARRFLRFCSKAARMLCEVVTATEQNLQNRDTSKQEAVEAMRRIRERLGLGFFLYFVLPPPLHSSTHSIKTRLLRSACSRSG